MDKFKKAIFVVLLVLGLVLGNASVNVQADGYDDTPNPPVVTGH